MDRKKKQFAWWYYFWFLVVLVVIAPFFGMHNLKDFAFWVLEIMGLVGLWAYLRRRAVVSRHIWRLYLLGMSAVILYSCVMLVVGEHADPFGDGSWQIVLIGSWLLTFLIILPLFIALWRYSFQSHEIWRHKAGAA